MGRKTKSESRRDKFLDMFYEKLRVLLDDCKDSLAFRNLSVSYGILVDKQLLCEGKATSRTAVEGGTDPVEELRKRIHAGHSYENSNGD